MAAERLETGWFEDTPAHDTVLRAALLNAAARMRLVIDSLGGRHDSDDLAFVGCTDSPSLFGNPVLVLRPLAEVETPGFVERLRAVGAGVPMGVMSPYPTPDLGAHGLTLDGHPPFMVRSPDPIGDPDVPAGLEIRPVRDAAGVADYEHVLARGFPMTEIEEPTGALFGPALLDSEFRMFVGYADDEPATCAAAMLSHGVTQVEWVATIDAHRGRGYGEAMTWRAILAEPSQPAVLIASDAGRPIYERMGFLPIFRWTFWTLPAAG